jgi:lipoprotein NlpI
MLPVLIKRAGVLVFALYLGGCSMGSMTTWLKTDDSNPDVQQTEFVKSEIPAAIVRRYEAALKTMQAGDDLRASHEFEKFIADYPEYPGAYLNLAILQERQDQSDLAMETLRRGIAQDPAYAPAHNQMGILYREQGDFDAAADSYQAAINADPQYALAYLNMGVLNDLYRQNSRVALDYYEQYRDLGGPDFDDAEVNRWILDLKRRVGAAQNSVQGASSGLTPTGEVK